MPTELDKPRTISQYGFPKTQNHIMGDAISSVQIIRTDSLIFSIRNKDIIPKKTVATIKSLNSKPITILLTIREAPTKRTKVNIRHLKKLEQWAPPVKTLKTREDSIIRPV